MLCYRSPAGLRPASGHPGLGLRGVPPAALTGHVKAWLEQTWFQQNAIKTPSDSK